MPILPKFFRRLCCCAAVGTLVLATSRASATPLDDIGYTRLATEQGVALSTGAGIRVIQTEASFGGGFYPTESNAEFTGKTFIFGSGDGAESSHATSVGRRFFGTDSSVAEGVTNITIYSAGGWLGNDYLRSLTGSLPRSSQARVANHSWISSGTSMQVLNDLQRMDYLVETDDFIQVAGVNNRPSGMEMPAEEFANAFNVLLVGTTDGDHSTGSVGTAGLAYPYSTVRVRPQLVAPFTETSWAAPMVAGAATMRVAQGHAHPTLSLGGTHTTSVGRANLQIYNAETSEVVRAALMAGASRKAITAAGSGSNYTIGSDNGLDLRFGAGQVNVYDSYHIILAGEQNAHELGNANDIKLYGFDYDPSFAANTTRTYPFSVDNVPREFAATLAWNLDVNFQSIGGIQTDPSLDLRDLNLRLRNADTGATVASSFGLTDVSENLYIPVLGKGNYELVVSAAGYFPTNPFLIDYGLAWRMTPTSTPQMGDVNLDGGVSLQDLTALQSHLGMTERAVWTDGDLNFDGRVDRKDAALFAQNFGEGSILGGLPPGKGKSPQIGVGTITGPQAVPEPSTLALLACGALAMAAPLWYRRGTRHRAAA
jgi:hypothetical protein